MNAALSSGRLLALLLAVMPLCAAGAARAQDSDGDGLTDAEEVSRVRAVPFGQQRVINPSIGARQVLAADLDGDGAPDVLAASPESDVVAWYENRLDEPSANFGPQQLITTQADGAGSVVAVDLDGDGDADVLSASYRDYKIAWYENRLDEPGANFGAQQVITTGAYGAASVYAADLDSDGDADALSASSWDNEIAWYENRLDEPSADFGEQQLITGAANEAFSVFAVDLDGDGDPDVVSGYRYGLAWYENRLDEPTADFGAGQVITTATNSFRSIFLADLDGDGDPDVLAGSYADEEIAWYENRLNEASAGFGSKQTVATVDRYALSVFALDFDGDGDRDVLSASYTWFDDKVVWYENRLDEPSADFGAQQMVTTAAEGSRSVFAADLDGDGDPDVLSASYNPYYTQYDDMIAWYENPGTDPLVPDSDGDGLLDGAEVTVHRTDPNQADSDGDGLSDFDEVNLYPTDPLDEDSDDDGLSDFDEVDTYATDPMSPDTDGDGYRDGPEVWRGSDPRSPGSIPQAVPAMFQASFILHAFGNDATTGTAHPYTANSWTALPLGYDCQHAEPYTINDGPSTRYCSPTRWQRGHPATGMWTHSVLTGTPLRITLQQSDLGVHLYTQTNKTVPPLSGATPHCCRGFLLSYPFQSFTYATFANAAGSFFAGGGAAADAGYNNRTGMQGSGTWHIRAGANAFGGAMGLLGKFGATGKYTITGKTGTYNGVSSWNMIPALGRPQYNTIISYGKMGTPIYQNPFSDTDKWYKTTPKGAVKVSTISQVGSGTVWTTGPVGAFAKMGAYYTSLWRTGFDTLTLGGRNIQLVTPGLTHWLVSGNDEHTAHIGILKLRIVPEPERFALLALGLGVLLALRYCAGRPGRGDR
jgi:hypothetical protein